MCRISFIAGSKFHNDKTRKLIEELQDCGATIDAETVSGADYSIIISRFAVTSSKFLKGGFPLHDDRYIFSYNGEVYSFQNKTFIKSNSQSDVHFAFQLIKEHGHEKFFREADFEGTFFIYEKESSQLFVYVDQLNTKGCFYTVFNHSIIISQEYSIINNVLKRNFVKGKTSINSVKRGHCLKVTKKNRITVFEYKPDFGSIFQGGELNEKSAVLQIKKALSKSIVDRIPKDGVFGVLCSGGVDSSILLKVVYDHLKNCNEIERLKIFTLSSDSNYLIGEDNDLQNILLLLKDLDIDTTEHFSKIAINEKWKRYLLEKEVFHSPYRLLTPNPAQTQVRHTITMSCVLASIAIHYPDIKVLMTGDFADEIFGGYNSMHSGNLSELMSNIQHKLDDLQLNDASRVTLSSLRGCKKILRDCEKSSVCHPIEIRTPYASPLVANALKDISCTLLVGKSNGLLHSKYLLRRLSIEIGISEDISWRKKIPFNEGGTGIRNAEIDTVEELFSINYLKKNKKLLGMKEFTLMKSLGLNPDSIFEKALFHSALQNGFQRLLSGNSFREVMPDSNYSTKGTLLELYSL